MKKLTSSPLPDLEDADYAAKLRPLGEAIIPRNGQSLVRTSDYTDKRKSGYISIRSSGYKEDPTSENSEARKFGQIETRISVAERIEQIEQIRGPKRRFEFLIPVRVGDALAKDASERGQSAATQLLEILRDAGYPVIPEDFVDLRKEKGRA